MGKTADRTKGIFALILLAIIYAGTGVVTRYLNNYFSLFQQIYIRTILALILGFLFFGKSLHYEKLKKITLSEWLLLFIRSAASFVFGAALWVQASTITKLANIAFIDALPITATLSFLFLKEKATIQKIILLLFSYIGVILLSVKDFSTGLVFGYGELLVFISGFFFAFRNISRRWHSQLLNDAEITQLMFFFGALTLLIVSFIFNESLVFPPWNGGLAFMLLIGGAIMIANIFLSNYAFAHVGAVLANNILNLEAVFAILVGFLLYREISSFQELVGGILIITSVVAMNRMKEKT